MGLTRTISAAEARRIALAAQGFGARARGRATPSAVVGAVERLGVLQLDSVNVVCRAHYLPLFARLGTYDRSAVDDAAWAAPRSLFEYWGHQASFVPVKMHPLFRWRMDRAARGEGVWGSIARFGVERREYVEEVLAEVNARGPLRASEILSHAPRRGTWWTRSDAKIALEWLFWSGKVATASRRHFERVYDVAERVLPREVLTAPTPAPDDARRALLTVSARALGVATEDDLRDYFRLGQAESRPRIAELVEEGVIERVDVEGWDRKAYLATDAAIPRKVRATALLTPFDPLVWHRARAARLFGFEYRIEIYTPAHARLHGYYVLPFLLDDRLVGRIDLKSERERSALAVRAAHVEDGVEPKAVAAPLASELARLAAWLGLERVVVSRKGRLAPELRRAVGA